MRSVKEYVKGTRLAPFARVVYRGLHRLAPESESVWMNRIYDLQTVEVMRRCLQPDSVGIDVGAHGGDLLKEMVALAPHGAHYAFEPIPHLAKGLRRLYPKIRVFEMALSDRDGSSTFEHVTDASGYSGLRRRIYDRPNLRVEQLSVRTGRMDSVVPAETQVSFIKIDVEGGEYHVMLGGVETIKRSRPVIVFEAGPKSTSCYDVTPEAMFELVVGRCGLHLSTMERWLENAPPYSAKEFCESFEKGSDYYFIAYP